MITPMQKAPRANYLHFSMTFGGAMLVDAPNHDLKKGQLVSITGVDGPQTSFIIRSGMKTLVASKQEVAVLPDHQKALDAKLAEARRLIST